MKHGHASRCVAHAEVIADLLLTAAMQQVIFGLGANVGDPLAQLAAAVTRLRDVVEIASVSSVYRTAPIGFAQQPDFLNLVVVGRSAVPPERLLAEAIDIERELGRIRTFQNAPRVIDIDLLSWGGVAVDSPALTLPHPRLQDRAFVLVPLAEVAPEWRHPLLNLTAAEMLACLDDPGRVEPAGHLPDST